jgi:hypothetical protein
MTDYMIENEFDKNRSNKWDVSRLYNSANQVGRSCIHPRAVIYFTIPLLVLLIHFSN